jgi:hypothetical protein
MMLLAAASAGVVNSTTVSFTIASYSAGTPGFRAISSSPYTIADGGRGIWINASDYVVANDSMHVIFTNAANISEKSLVYGNITKTTDAWTSFLNNTYIVRGSIALNTTDSPWIVYSQAIGANKALNGLKYYTGAAWVNETINATSRGAIYETMDIAISPVDNRVYVARTINSTAIEILNRTAASTFSSIYTISNATIKTSERSFDLYVDNGGYVWLAYAVDTGSYDYIWVANNTGGSFTRQQVYAVSYVGGDDINFGDMQRYSNTIILPTLEQDSDDIRVYHCTYNACVAPMSVWAAESMYSSKDGMQFGFSVGSTGNKKLSYTMYTANPAVRYTYTASFNGTSALSGVGQLANHTNGYGTISGISLANGEWSLFSHDTTNATYANFYVISPSTSFTTYTRTTLYDSLQSHLSPVVSQRMMLDNDTNTVYMINGTSSSYAISWSDWHNFSNYTMVPSTASGWRTAYYCSNSSTLYVGGSNASGQPTFMSYNKTNATVYDLTNLTKTPIGMMTGCFGNYADKIFLTSTTAGTLWMYDATNGTVSDKSTKDVGAWATGTLTWLMCNSTGVYTIDTVSNLGFYSIASDTWYSLNNKTYYGWNGTTTLSGLWPGQPVYDSANGGLWFYSSDSSFYPSFFSENDGRWYTASYLMQPNRLDNGTLSGAYASLASNGDDILVLSAYNTPADSSRQTTSHTSILNISSINMTMPLGIDAPGKYNPAPVEGDYNLTGETVGTGMSSYVPVYTLIDTTSSTFIAQQYSELGMLTLSYLRPNASDSGWLGRDSDAKFTASCHAEGLASLNMSIYVFKNGVNETASYSTAPVYPDTFYDVYNIYADNITHGDKYVVYLSCSNDTWEAPWLPSYLWVKDGIVTCDTAYLSNST